MVSFQIIVCPPTVAYENLVWFVRCILLIFFAMRAAISGCATGRGATKLGMMLYIVVAMEGTVDGKACEWFCYFFLFFFFGSFMNFNLFLHLYNENFNFFSIFL
jgi:hypothetical protein